MLDFLGGKQGTLFPGGMVLNAPPPLDPPVAAACNFCKHDTPPDNFSAIYFSAIC